MRCILTPAQIKAARAWLGWKQVDLAKKSGVSVPTIKNVEGGQDARMSTMNKIASAFGDAGIEFLEDSVKLH